METYLGDAAKHGAKFLCDAHVHQILRSSDGKQVHGVNVVIHPRKPNEKHITIQTKCVIVAGGSIQTPALLLRSGFKNQHIGKHLRLHPVALVSGYFPDKLIKPFEGSILTTISPCADYSDSNSHYGCKLEVPTAHPSIFASVMSYSLPTDREKSDLSTFECPNTVDYRLNCTKFAHMSPIIVLQRDNDSCATVTIEKSGEPRVAFRAGRNDLLNLKEGMVKAMHVLVAAGATELFLVCL
jgi:hypothetical protein